MAGGGGEGSGRSRRRRAEGSRRCAEPPPPPPPPGAGSTEGASRAPGCAGPAAPRSGRQVRARARAQPRGMGDPDGAEFGTREGRGKAKEEEEEEGRSGGKPPRDHRVREEVAARAPRSNQLAGSGASCACAAAPPPPSLIPSVPPRDPPSQALRACTGVRARARSDTARLGTRARRRGRHVGSERACVCARGRAGSRGGDGRGGGKVGEWGGEISRGRAVPAGAGRLRDGGAALGVLGNGNGGPGGGDPAISLLPAGVPRTAREAGRGRAPRGSATGSAPGPPSLPPPRPGPASPQLTSRCPGRTSLLRAAPAPPRRWSPPAASGTNVRQRLGSGPGLPAGQEGPRNLWLRFAPRSFLTEAVCGRGFPGLLWLGRALGAGTLCCCCAQPWLLNARSSCRRAQKTSQI